MFQNVQASADTSRFADTDPHDLLAQYETFKIVTCPICQAVYRPALSQQVVLQCSCAVLEAAFLRVCHFCFRCQRPACPQCWNPVHAACVACGKEAHLPFLSPVPFLEGLVFAPSVFPHLVQAADIPFACLRNGRFAQIDPTPTGKIPIVRPAEVSSSLDPRTPGELPVVQVERATEASNYPSWLQEIMGHRAEELVAETSVQELERVQEESFVRVGSASMLEESAWPAWWQESSPSPSPQRVGVLADEIGGIGVLGREMLAISRVPVDEEMTLLERVENGLIVIMSMILLALVAMIVLSLRSASMNAFFLQLLHVDIRSEIAYLFQSI